jgi:hypothetical protein
MLRSKLTASGYVLFSFTFAWSVTGCNTAERLLEGKECGPAGECAKGFVCDLRTNACVTHSGLGSERSADDQEDNGEPETESPNEPALGPAAGSSMDPEASPGGQEDAGAAEAPPDMQLDAIDAGSAVAQGSPVADSGVAEPEPTDDEVSLPSAEVPLPCNSGAFSVPEPIWGPSSIAGRHGGASFTPDALTLYLMGTAYGTFNNNGSGYTTSIYRAKRPDRDSPFGEAEPVDELQVGAPTGTPHIGQAGLGLYFYKEDADRDLYQATRADVDSPWSDIVALSNVNSDSDDYSPWLSSDRLGLYFTSHRGGGEGASDLWYAGRALATGPFGMPFVLSNVNSTADERSPTTTPDEQTLYFTSDRAGVGDVFEATRSSKGGAFTEPKVVEELSSTGDDSYVALSRDGREIVIASNRGGYNDLWLARRNCE